MRSTPSPSCCPTTPKRITGEGCEVVPIGALALDDVVLVRPGGRVPADGDIVEGEADVDESMVTGESRPVAKSVGDHVVAGTVATDSSLRVRVTGGRRRHGAGRHPAAGGPGAGVALPGPGAGGPRRRPAVLRGGGSRRRHRRRLAGGRERRRGGGPNRGGARHRLPPCPRSGHPTGHLHLHRDGGSWGDPGQGPARPRADANRRPGAVRQDRHPDAGAAMWYGT